MSVCNGEKNCTQHELIKINHHHRLSALLPFFFNFMVLLTRENYCESFIALSRTSITFKHKKNADELTLMMY